MEQTREDKKISKLSGLSKRNKLLLGIILLSLIEMICFYFIGKPYSFLQGLDEIITWIFFGNIIFFAAYFLLLDNSNFRKKYVLILIAYALLVIAPFTFYSKIPNTTVEEAQQLITRSEGGKVVKDRDYSATILTYEGQEVYLIAIEKKGKTHRFAFDPETQRYYSF